MLLWFLSSSWDFYPEKLCFPVPLIHGELRLEGKLALDLLVF